MNASVDIFTPKCRAVFDPNADTMATPIAVLVTSWGCVAVQNYFKSYLPVLFSLFVTRAPFSWTPPITPYAILIQLPEQKPCPPYVNGNMCDTNSWNFSRELSRGAKQRFTRFLDAAENFLFQRSHVSDRTNKSSPMWLYHINEVV